MPKIVFVFLYSVAMLSGLFSAASLVVPEWTDFLIFSAPILVASLLLLLKQLKPRSRRPRRAASLKPRVVVDGSNVLYWRDNTPDPEPVCVVSQRLEKLGYVPRIYFDANAGYLVAGRYLHDHDFEKLLGLPRGSVTVVPKGTIADQEILQTARKLKAKIVTNDRYRDWAESFPEVRRKGFLIKGRYSGNNLLLDGPPAVEKSKPAA